MNHSIVIPIGTFSFFVNANIANIYETTNEPLDIVFVTSNDVEEHIQKALDDALRRYREVRVLKAPFNSGSNHLKLLDWAIREPSINEWMITQHCDAFWEEEGWLSDINDAMSDNVAAICLPNYQFKLNDLHFPIVGDTFGAYRREKIIQHNWSFQWGHYSDESVSQKTNTLMENGDLRWINNDTRFLKGDFLDGSVIMSLEMAAENPKLIKMIYPNGLCHLLAFFRICDSIHWHKEEKSIVVDLPFMEDFGGCSKTLWIDAITKYSFLTSLLFDKKEVKNPFPWSLLEKIALEEQISLAGGTRVCEWVSRYSKCKKEDALGMNDLGVNKISFKNKEYNL